MPAAGSVALTLNGLVGFALPLTLLGTECLHAHALGRWVLPAGLAGLRVCGPACMRGCVAERPAPAAPRRARPHLQGCIGCRGLRIHEDLLLLASCLLGGQLCRLCSRLATDELALAAVCCPASRTAGGGGEGRPTSVSGSHLHRAPAPLPLSVPAAACRPALTPLQRGLTPMGPAGGRRRRSCPPTHRSARMRAFTASSCCICTSRCASAAALILLTLACSAS